MQRLDRDLVRHRGQTLVRDLERLFVFKDGIGLNPATLIEGEQGRVRPSSTKEFTAAGLVIAVLLVLIVRRYARRPRQT